MTLVPKLASRTGSQVIFAYAERLSGGRGYHVVFEPADDGIYEADSASATAAMNRSVERCIRALPSQYQWSYKRYRKRPDDDSERFY